MAHEDAFIMLKSLGMNANREKYSETVNWSQEIILEAAQLKMKENRQRLIDFIKYQDDNGSIEAGHLISSIAIGVDVQYNRSPTSTAWCRSVCNCHLSSTRCSFDRRHQGPRRTSKKLSF
jgi:hypothetical protein